MAALLVCYVHTPRLGRLCTHSLEPHLSMNGRTSPFSVALLQVPQNIRDYQPNTGWNMSQKALQRRVNYFLFEGEALLGIELLALPDKQCSKNRLKWTDQVWILKNRETRKQNINNPQHTLSLSPQEKKICKSMSNKSRNKNAQKMEWVKETLIPYQFHSSCYVQIGLGSPGSRGH